MRLETAYHGGSDVPLIAQHQNRCLPRTSTLTRRSIRSGWTRPFQYPSACSIPAVHRACPARFGEFGAGAVSTRVSKGLEQNGGVRI